MKIINERKMYSCYIKNILLANNSRKKLIKIGAYFIFLSVAILIALIPTIMNKKNNVEYKRFTTDLKYILFWKQPKKTKKNFYSRSVEYFTGQTQFIKQNCPQINCYITYNKSLLGTEGNLDAIVFDIHNIKKMKVHTMKLVRSPRQVYIFKSHESSEYHPLCDPAFDDFFNWTWTYKLDSDVSHPFINVHDLKNNLIGPRYSVDWIKDMTHTEKFKTKVADKVKAVAWFIGNCKMKQKHLDFVKDLKKELKGYNYSVDMFGPCSEKKCPKGGISNCFKIIDKEYYFNLVLEDSFADDYVTEKIVKAMTFFSVPIVNGASNYTNFLPPGSYINARSFDLKKLGAVLDYLIKNPEKYSYFFDWKNYYQYSARPRSYLCDLCTQLNQNNNIPKSYKEIRRWWNSDFKDICQGAHMYNLFRDTP